MDTEALALQVAAVRPRAERLVFLEADFRSFKEQYTRDFQIRNDVVLPAAAVPAGRLGQPATPDNLQLRYAKVIEGSRQILTKMVSHFEIFAAGVCVHDALHIFDVTTAEEFGARAGQLHQHVQRCAGLDLETVVAEAKAVGTLPPDPPKREFSLKPLDELLRHARYMLDMEPAVVSAVDELGREPELGALVHRVRRAWAVIEAFLYRNDPQLQTAIRTAGLAYSSGRLELKEVSALLARPTEDVIVEFERCGFHRPVSVITLESDARTEIQRRMRDDRLKRGGQPMYDATAVRRDVVATQRIEGVDARPWLKPAS